MNIPITPRFRHVLMLSFSLLLFSCNSSADKTTKTAESTIEADHTEHKGEQGETNTSALSLNNGAKWQTDESTRIHITRLMDSLQAFHANTNADHNAYSALASGMQREMDSLIMDCKMKGPDHEALHLWLQPVLQDIKDLATAVTTEQAKQVTEKLSLDVEKFNQYFN